MNAVRCARRPGTGEGGGRHYTAGTCDDVSPSPPSPPTGTTCGSREARGPPGLSLRRGRWTVDGRTVPAARARPARKRQNVAIPRHRAIRPTFAQCIMQRGPAGRGTPFPFPLFPSLFPLPFPSTSSARATLSPPRSAPPAAGRAPERTSPRAASCRGDAHPRDQTTWPPRMLSMGGGGGGWLRVSAKESVGTSPDLLGSRKRIRGGRGKREEGRRGGGQALARGMGCTRRPDAAGAAYLDSCCGYLRQAGPGTRTGGAGAARSRGRGVGVGVGVGGLDRRDQLPGFVAGRRTLRRRWTRTRPRSERPWPQKSGTGQEGGGGGRDRRGTGAGAVCESLATRVRLPGASRCDASSCTPRTRTTRTSNSRRALREPCHSTRSSVARAPVTDRQSDTDGGCGEASPSTYDRTCTVISLAGVPGPRTVAGVTRALL
ncbi:hypothetical protein BC628DRAFT_911413 [Trametes gibbosa]|nr:hypothetical protein BC628DRAFT_911413 [Trametes gibbosa]